MASTAIIAGATLVAIPAAAVAAPAANNAESCIPEGGGIGNGNPNAVDGQANVYVGGNFTLTSGAELEGLLVVEGNATFGGVGLYNAGVVGVGSLLTPPPMSDMILVGGDMAVTQGRQLDVGHAIGGGVRVGGKLTAAPNAIETNGAELASNVGKAAALGDRTALGGVIAQQSKAYAAMKTTGTATAEYGILTLKGDGSKNRQVFSLTAAEVAGASSLKYDNIDSEAIVVVNVVGDVAKFNLTAMLKANGSPMDPMNIDKSAFGALTQRLLWNFPTAKDVVIGGTAQFPGSVLVANPASTTAVKVPGTNGRMWVAGNLVHDLGTGSEIHAFPFLDGDVFGCDPTPPAVELAQPKVTQAACLPDGKVSAPKVELPTSGTLNYTHSGKVAAGETVTVTATSLNGNKIAALAGWTLAGDALSATIKITLADVACDQPVAPVAPTVNQAVCTEDGSAAVPSVTLAETAGVTYSVDGDVKAGSTVTVTATAEKGSFLTAAEGWTLSEDEKTATFTVELKDVACDQPVAPVAPTVAQAVCTEDGSATAPSVTLAETAGVTYSVDGDVKAGSTVTVTATAAEGSFLKPTKGWTVADDKKTATFTVELKDVACDQPVAPVAPTVAQAVCTEDGSAAAPSVTLAETAGVAYEVAGDVKAGSTVTVTATADKGSFFTETEGWTLSEDKKTATFTVELKDVDCDQPVAPVAPTVNQAVCTEDGSATAPSVTLAETAGVTYSVDGDVKAGSTVTVTATADKGSFFTEIEGWTLSEDKKTATFTVELADTACDQPGTPVMPRISEAECTVTGAPTLPAVTPAESAGVTYAIEGLPVAGGTVTVTATAAEGFFLKVVDGWKYASDNRSATLAVSFADLACDQPVAPVAPTVAQAVCTEDGSATAPTVTVAETAGITYEVAGEVKAGSTVTVTATANVGYFLEKVKGWVLSDDKKSATFTVDLENIVCDRPVALVVPTVTQAVCTEDGSVTLPTITLAETAGVTYEVIGEVLPGKSVKVVAKPTAGFFFTAADGWGTTDAGAEFTVQLAEVDCITIPVKPEPEPTPVPEDKSVPPTDLAVSGAGSLPAVGIGAAALLILGVSALLVTRARRSRSIAE
ncbi:MAG: choice-of-anchor A family protein [Leucobacter sp.]